jgi:hypothetical protein
MGLCCCLFAACTVGVAPPGSRARVRYGAGDLTTGQVTLGPSAAVAIEIELAQERAR